MTYLPLRGVEVLDLGILIPPAPEIDEHRAEVREEWLGAD